MSWAMLECGHVAAVPVVGQRRKGGKMPGKLTCGACKDKRRVVGPGRKP